MEGGALISWDKEKKEEKQFVYLFESRIVFTSGSALEQDYVAHLELEKTVLEKKNKQNSTASLTLSSGKRQVTMKPSDHVDLSSWVDTLSLLLLRQKDEFDHFEKAPTIPSVCTLNQFFAALTNPLCPEKEFQRAVTALLINRPLLFPTSVILLSIESQARVSDVFGKIRLAQLLCEWLQLYYFSRDFRNSPNADLLQELLIMSDVLAVDGWSEKLNTLFHKRLLSKEAEEKMNYERLKTVLSFSKPTGGFPKSVSNIVTDVKYRVTAQQLTLMESLNFSEINISEVQKQVWNKMPEAAPNVRQMIAHFNRFSTYIIYAIVKVEIIN